jgi:hypothetical protein
MAGPQRDRGPHALVGVRRRHADVGDHDIRRQLLHSGQKLVVVGGQSDNRQVGLVAEQ